MNDLYMRQETLNLNTKQTVTIIGCGGIGYWVGKFLAMSGIEKIYAFDHDIMEKHNFNRIDLPYLKFIGKNKADILKLIVENLRPDCDIETFPYEFSENHILFINDSDWLLDCTDILETQMKNQKIARNNGIKYVKAGYDGTRVSISDSVATWGKAPDGYTITPSWVSPAVIVASMVVAKIMKYTDKEMGCNIERLYI